MTAPGDMTGQDRTGQRDGSTGRTDRRVSGSSGGRTVQRCAISCRTVSSDMGAVTDGQPAGRVVSAVGRHGAGPAHPRYVPLGQVRLTPAAASEQRPVRGRLNLHQLTDRRTDRQTERRTDGRTDRRRGSARSSPLPAPAPRHSGCPVRSRTCLSPPPSAAPSSSAVQESANADLPAVAGRGTLRSVVRAASPTRARRDATRCDAIP